MAVFIVLIVKLLKMGGETEIASTCSEENIGRNPKLVGYINHGGAEHVDDEAGDDGGIGKLGNGVSDILFLGFYEGFKQSGNIKVRGNGVFGEGEESDPRVVVGLEMGGGNGVPRGRDEEESG